MFKKKRCPKCEREVKEDWEFCPYCGYSLKEKYREERFFEEFESFGDFNRIFERIEREFEEMFKMPVFRIPKIRVSSPGVSGISITIHSRTGMKPKIEVKTYGDYKKFEPEIKKRLGIRVPVEEVEEEKPRVEREVKVTEEAETEVKTLGNKMIISVKLPGVESEDDIEIKRLEESLEIKAFAGDKAYFTLIPLPGTASIVKKEFKNGVLRVEVEK
jgi:HSP20 family molecular chaperone IbpA